MRIAITAGLLAAATGLAVAAPAEAQRYHHGPGYRVGYQHGHGRPFHGGPRYADGYGYRGYGHGYGPHYRRGRVVCSYRHGLRRCFRA